MTVNIGMAPGAREPKWPLALLFAAALVETVGGLTGLTLFRDLHEFESSPAQWAIVANLAVAPFIAIAALVFVARGKPRYAIMALAAITIIALLLDTVPSLVLYGREALGGGLIAAYLFVRMLVLPALCAWAAWLAWKDTRLTLAALLAVLPTIASMIDLLSFAAGVALYGS